LCPCSFFNRPAGPPAGPNKQSMNKITSYFTESYKELVEKVTWPNWNQLQQSTVIVLVATGVITLVVLAMDTVSRGLLTLVYSLFKS
jgi:preprotein translocase subunit SecE